MTPDRRTFLTAGFGGTAALASRTHGLMTPARSHAGETLYSSGDLDSDPNVRAAAAQDFGHLVYKRPRAVFRPATRSDIASLMRYAAHQGLKVAARGQGHSIYGRALAEDGIVIGMGTISTIRAVEPDRVVVEAGATWGSVLEATLAKGLTPPVLTNYLGLSIGGTIAVGGIGATSSRHGMQTDQIVELDVVTGDGSEMTCSTTSNPDLFDAARAGLGQCGIVTQATLRLIRAPDRVRRYQLLYRDLASLTSDQRRALTEQRFDQLQGALLPDRDGGWRYQLEGAVFYNRDTAPDDKTVLSTFSDDRRLAVIADQTYHDDAFAFSKFETLLRSNGQWFNSQPWLLTFLRGSNAQEVASEILARLTGDYIGPFGRITYYPLDTSAFRTPLVRLPDKGVPPDGVVFPFNIIRIPTSNDAATVELLVAQNRQLYDLIRKAGGVQYPVGAFPMSVNDWKDHFGSSLPLLSRAKRRYDPGNSLTPGYNVF
jgi:cytokinin dehydrogenase